MARLKAPGPLSLEGNVSLNWKTWKRSWTLFTTATELGKKDEDIQCATFLHVAGAAAQQVFETLTFSAAEKDKIDVLIQKFEDYCEPRKNKSLLRYNLKQKQKVEEKFDVFVTELQTLAKECEYGALHELLMD